MSYFPSSDTPPANWHFAHPEANLRSQVSLHDPNRNDGIHLGPFRSITYIRHGNKRRAHDRGAFWHEADALAWVRTQIEDLLAKGWKLAGTTWRSREIMKAGFDFDRLYADGTRPRCAPWEVCTAAPAHALPVARHAVRLPLENAGRLLDVLVDMESEALLAIDGELAMSIDIETDEMGNQTRSHFVNLRTGDFHQPPLTARRILNRHVTTAGGLQRLTKGLSRSAPTLADGRVITGISVEVDPGNAAAEDATVAQVLSGSRFLNFLTN